MGLTATAGWEVGVRRMVSAPADAVWALLMDRRDLWVGDAETEIRVQVPPDRIRLQWSPRDSGWARPATLQIRLIPSGPRTTIAVHLEHLPDAAARESMREHWTRVIASVVTALGPGS